MLHTHLSHICINTNFTLLASSSSPSITQMDTTSDITVKSTETGDTISGRQNILKTFAKIYVWQNIHIDIWKKLIDMWKLYQHIKIQMISRYDMKKDSSI